MTALALAVALLLPASLGAAPPAEETIEGTYWKVRDNSFASKIFFWRYDTVLFKDGSFRSRRWEAKGFPAAPYAASRSGEATAWTATLTDGGDGKVVWEGHRVGDRMEGTWTWLKLEGRSEPMSWSAKQMFSAGR